MNANSLLNLKTLRAIEQQAFHDGVDLMAQAALAAADWVSMRYSTGAKIWVTAGTGNNGGDALFAAKILHQRGFVVSCIVQTPPVAEATKKALTACIHQGMHIVSTPSLLANLVKDTPPDLIIDGLLGIGLNRKPNMLLTEMIGILNHVNAPILALDVPSGLNAETGSASGAVINADDTLTFLGHKAGLWMAQGVEVAGRVHLADLLDYRIEKQSLFNSHVGELNLNHELALRQLVRPRNSNKGRFGSAVVVGGNHGMLGAALLAGRAALGAGAGKVRLNTIDVRLAVDPIAPELMIHEALTSLQGVQAVAVGPGLGQDERAKETLEFVLCESSLQMIIDADALNLIARQPAYVEKLQNRLTPAILTPHPGEAARLLDCTIAEIQSNRIMAAQQLAQQYASIVVLKGAGTVIAQPDNCFRVNTSGNSALAVAGQGDVLSGVIVAFLAQGLSAFEAACLAVYVHGLAGNIYEETANGTIGLAASATVSLISNVLNTLLTQI